MRHRTVSRPALTVLAGGCLFGSLVAGGCVVNPLSRDAMIRNNLTPELQTLYQRPVDVENAKAIAFNENGRMFWQDLSRTFYTDRPSRLTREPIPR